MIKNKIGLRFLKNNTSEWFPAYLGMDGVLRYKLINHWSQGVHVYLLSNEEPKLGEWVYDNEFFLNWKMEEDRDAILVYQTDEEYYKIGKDCLKIIATTDLEILYNIASSEPLNIFVPRAIEKEELKEIIEKFNG